eukprot:8609369-Lingulodinium_polyedra.AAC.1
MARARFAAQHTFGERALVSERQRAVRRARVSSCSIDRAACVVGARRAFARVGLHRFRLC